jgi:hypothetical protein
MGTGPIKRLVVIILEETMEILQMKTKVGDLAGDKQIT